MLKRDTSTSSVQALIRRREWEYAASTALLSGEGREALRWQVVDEYGEELELIAPPESAKPRRKKGG